MLARKFQAAVLDRAEAKLFRNMDPQEQKHTVSQRSEYTPHFFVNIVLYLFM